MTPSRRKQVFFAVFVVSLGIFLGLVVLLSKPAPKITVSNALSLPKCQLANPDFLLRSKSLVSLPQELREIAYIGGFFQSKIWEDIAQSEARLSLSGTLHRLIFQHNLKIEDKLVSFLLDSPIEVALWGGRGGKLEDFIALIPRTGLGDLFVALGQIKDDQVEGQKIFTESGRAIEGTLIHYAPYRKLFLASHQDAIVVTNNTHCTIPDFAPTSKLESLVTWMGFSDEKSLFGKKFPLPENNTTQEMILSFGYLSGGYSSLISAVESLRISRGQTGWSTEINLKDNKTLKPNTDIWKTIPGDAALCLQLPVNLVRVGDIFGEMPDLAPLNLALEDVLHNTALCWMTDSSYLTPLVVAEKPPSISRDQLVGIFERLIGTGEKSGPPLATKITANNENFVIERQVSSKWGLKPATESENATALSESSYFDVSLASEGKYLLFSADSHNVSKAVSVIEHEFPSLGETIPAALKESTLIFLPTHFQAFLEKNLQAEISEDYEVALWSRFFPYISELGKKANLGLLLKTNAQKPTSVTLDFHEFKSE